MSIQHQAGRLVLGAILASIGMPGHASESPPPIELFEYLAEYVETADGRLLDPMQLPDRPTVTRDTNIRAEGAQR